MLLLYFWLFHAKIDRKHAEVAELADALDSGSSGTSTMRVQIPPSAPYMKVRRKADYRALRFLFM